MGRHRHGFEGAVRSKGLCPCKRRAKEIARLRPNPKGKRLALLSAALQRLSGCGQTVNTFLGHVVHAGHADLLNLPPA